MTETVKFALFDPRAESSPDDSDLWGLLLCWAYGEELLAYKRGEPCAHSLYGALHGLRCGLARLQASGNNVRLLRGDWTEVEYAQLREKYLLPHAQHLQELLKKLAAWHHEKTIADNWNKGDVAQEALL